MLNTEEQVRLKLEASRKELLDLGLRNPLLNYRTLRSRGVEIVDELPAEIFRILVREGKSMTFLPLSEDQDLTLSDQYEDVLSAELSNERHIDHKLQTKETAKKLEARLLDTYYTARTYIEEQGVSVLYLALGMLNWYEAEVSQELRRAPLILIPVELERSNARARFHLKYTEGEIGANLSLVAKIEVGIITPYRGQVSLIKRLIREARLPKPTMDKIKVGTVHAFQGSEADVIIWDLVDTSSHTIGKPYQGDIGNRLTNVAISRAQGKLIIIGD